MKIVNCRAAGSAQTCAKASRNGARLLVRRGRLQRIRVSVASLDAKHSQRRDGKGDRRTPSRSPRSIARSRTDRGNDRRAAPSARSRSIIMTQTIVAAAARRSGATRVASIAKTEVPAAPTPTPTSRKDKAASVEAGYRLRRQSMRSRPPRRRRQARARPCRR